MSTIIKRFLRFAQNDRSAFAQNGKISFLIVLMVLLSCERVVDFPKDPSGMIYIDAVVGGASNRINVQVSQPIDGSEDAVAENVILVMEADGKPVELLRDLDYESEEGVVSYIARTSFSPGQNLMLKASAEGLPSIKAATTVPHPLPRMDITCGLIDSYKNEDPGLVSSNIKELFNFRIVMDEEPREDSFFGVQILRRKLHDYVGVVPDTTKEHYESLSEDVYDDIYVYTDMAEHSGLSSLKVELVTDFDGGEMKVSPASPDNGRSVLGVQVKPKARRMLVGSYNSETDENYEVYEYFLYKVRVYRLSKEMYHCLRAGFIAKHSDAPIDLGFTPVTYTYTNINGGLGIFGAVSLYETDWQSYEFE